MHLEPTKALLLRFLSGVQVELALTTKSSKVNNNYWQATLLERLNASLIDILKKNSVNKETTI